MDNSSSSRRHLLRHRPNRLSRAMAITMVACLAPMGKTGHRMVSHQATPLVQMDKATASLSHQGALIRAHRQVQALQEALQIMEVAQTPSASPRHLPIIQPHQGPTINRSTHRASKSLRCRRATTTTTITTSKPLRRAIQASLIMPMRTV